MNYLPLVTERYEDIRKKEYRRFVQELGEKVRFQDDVWICDKRIRSAAEVKSDVTLYFSRIPAVYRDAVKYFIAIQLVSGAGISTCAGKILSLTTFTCFLSMQIKPVSFSDCDISVASQYKDCLNGMCLAESTKALKWSGVNIFFRVMEGWEGISHKNPFTDNPYMDYRRRSYKYIPDSIITKMDRVFINEGIPVYLRCIYWVLRLIPSRINEVLGMKIECLKPYNGHYCLFIPTWKQNGGYWEPIMRAIHMEDTGTSGKLIALIREQQQAAREMQPYMEEDKKDALFTYRKAFWLGNGKRVFTNEFKTVYKAHVSRYFRLICAEYGIMDETGEPYRITSHQFRHNGITDRLAAGFTPEQIMFMTAHHGDAMIYKAYNHLDLMPEVITEKQLYVLDEPERDAKTNVFFGGRILNMEEQLEKRLLKNIRAHRVQGGICSDITGCKSDMFHCLECEFLIPDAGQIGYFEKQADMWIEKSEKFSQFPIIRANALRNAELFRETAKKIRQAEEGEPDGKNTKETCGKTGNPKAENCQSCNEGNP